MSNNSDARPLAGQIIGISVSDSDDLAAMGYTSADVNRVTIILSEMLLAAGARLVFGHDWRPDGVMAAITGLAAKHQTQLPDAAVLIENLLAWPDQPQGDQELREELARRRLVNVESLQFCDRGNAAMPHTAKRALALTQMRQELTRRCTARICIGGKAGRSGALPQGFFAGVVEEAYWAAKEGQPLFLGRFLGGVSAEIIRFFEADQLETPEIFYPLSDKRPLLDNLQTTPVSQADDCIPPFDLSGAFQQQTFRDNAHCSDKLWNRLVNATDADTFGMLVVHALSRKV